MKITVRGSDVLILEDLGAPLRMVGAILLALGAGFAWAGSSTTAAIAPYVIAVIAGLAGLAALVLPQRVTAAFDRTRHTLVITRRSVLRGFTRDEVDFSKIASVEAEPGQMINRSSDQTYRVCIVLQDGTRLPLTTYYSNSSCHAIAAAAASEFLGLPAAQVTPAHSAMPSAVMGHPNSKAALILTFLLSSGFCAVGGTLLWKEIHLLQVAQPVSAVVLSTEVITKRGSKSTTYAPAVSFRYEAPGGTRISNRVTILNESRSGNWAYNLANRWHAGQVTTAWYDPHDPDHAFLLHEISLLPVFFVAFALLFMLVVVWTANNDKKLRAAAAQVTPAG